MLKRASEDGMDTFCIEELDVSVATLSASVTYYPGMAQYPAKNSVTAEVDQLIIMAF